MTVLLLRLAGPMQSWGDSSRFSRRATCAQPTKSGVLGLVAAAQGRRRTDPLTDLLDLRIGVRTDQAGRVLEDFQTARSLDGKKSMPLSTRHYLADAIFLVGLEGEDTLIRSLAGAIQNPHYAPYLGRRAFAPTGKVFLKVGNFSLKESLSSWPWLASDWYKARQKKQGYWAEVSVDSDLMTAEEISSFPGAELRQARDIPLSWDTEHREYGWRNVINYQTQLAAAQGISRHDPMEF